MGPFSWNGCQTLHTQSFWWGLSLTCPLLESYFIPTRVIGSIAYTTKDMLQLFKYNTILSICVPFKAHIYDPIMWRPWRWEITHSSHISFCYNALTPSCCCVYISAQKDLSSPVPHFWHFLRKWGLSLKEICHFPCLYLFINFLEYETLTQVTQYTRNITCLKCTTQKYNWYWHEDWGADELSLIPIAQIPFGWLVFR